MTVLSPRAIRVKTSDGWQDIALTGPPGPTGPAGPAGPPGADGTSGGGGGAGMLDTQRVTSTLEAYRGIGSSGDPLCIDSASSVPLALSFTPTVACWWEVHFHAAVFRKDTSGYQYGQAMLKLTPADVDGISQARVHDTQDSGENTYVGRHGSRLFKLAASTAYTATVVAVFPGGAAFSYYAGQDYLYMEGKAWAR